MALLLEHFIFSRLTLSLSFVFSIVALSLPYRVRLISLSAQKFVADILNDALMHHKIRGPAQSTKKAGKVLFLVY